MTGERQTPSTAGWDPARGEWVEPLRTEEPAAPVTPSTPSDRTWLRAGIVGGLIGAVIASAVIFPVALSRRGGGTVVERRLSSGGTVTRQGVASIVDIAARARPWVVNVSVTGAQFGASLGVLGSGVILRSDGYILTNNHVVEGGDKVEVTLASGEKIPGQIVGTDPETDVAVVKVNRADLPSAVIGSAKDLKVGEVAVAIGSPLGLEQTVTAGIVSALGRDIPRQGQPPLVDMVQTDASITEGNSGGALVNADGAVIGINTLIASAPGSQIGFAIPIDIAVAVAHELIASGHATHPWLGISGKTVTPEVAKKFGVAQGAFVEQVVSSGPAARAGMKANDIVVSFEGQNIGSMDELIVEIRVHKVGDRVQLVVVRGGRRINLTATLENRPSNL